MKWRLPCAGDSETDCGYVYMDDYTLEEFWVTCAEYESWFWCDEGSGRRPNYCGQPWMWEACSMSHWRWPCDGEGETTTYGYIYWDEFKREEYWVTDFEFLSWEWCF